MRPNSLRTGFLRRFMSDLQAAGFSTAQAQKNKINSFIKTIWTRQDLSYSSIRIMGEFVLLTWHPMSKPAEQIGVAIVCLDNQHYI